MTADRIRILYACPSIPPEWIVAHRLVAERVSTPMPAGVFSMPRRGSCPYVQAFLHRLSQNDLAGAVFTTRCDQMRRAFDLARSVTTVPLFLFNTPARCRCPDARQYYIVELRRLSRFFINCRRNTHSHGLASCPSQLSTGADQYRPAIRLALIGSCALSCDMPDDILNEFNAQIVLNTTQGTIYEPCRLPSDSHDNALELLADRYFTHMPDISHRPNDCFYQWLSRRLIRHKIDAVIVRFFPGCDIWHGEAVRLKAELDVPVLPLNIVPDQPQPDAGALQRIQAFLEMLQ